MKSLKWPLCGKTVLVIVAIGCASWAVASPIAHASITLDGTNCVVWGSQHDGDLARCVSDFGDGHTLSVSLHGLPKNNVKSISFSIDGAPLFQRIKLNARPVIDHVNVGVMIMDVNFDGSKDVAVMEALAGAPKQSFFFFIFDKFTEKFEPNVQLGSMPRIRIDPELKLVHSDWRQGSSLSGRNSYRWESGKLVLMQRSIRHNLSGHCVKKLFQRFHDEFLLTAVSPC